MPSLLEAAARKIQRPWRSLRRSGTGTRRTRIRSEYFIIIT
jgi:hypothetical protein